MITQELLAKLFPNTHPEFRIRFLAPLNKYCPQYGIDNYLRICAFLATGGVETDYLHTTTEYASGADYEGRKDLGNTNSGDGKKFKGRGFFQTTGRFNYGKLNPTIGKKIGNDFLINPQRLAEISVAVESACQFWQDHNLSRFADNGNFYAIQAIVNTGSQFGHPNQYQKRKDLYELCKTNIDKDFSFAAPVQLVTQPSTSPDQSETQDTPQISSSDSSQTGNSSQDNLVSDKQDEQNQQIGSSDSAQTTQTDSSCPSDDNSKLKDFCNKYLRHCPTDSLKNILTVLAGRISAPLVLLWTIGLTGKILLILAGLIIVGFASRTVYKYHSRLFGWVKTIADSFLGNDS